MTASNAKFLIKFPRLTHENSWLVFYQLIETIYIFVCGYESSPLLALGPIPNIENVDKLNKSNFENNNNLNY
jgi:hypothetical protein